LGKRGCSKLSGYNESKENTLVKAVIVSELGGPEVLKIQDVPEPELLNHQVMIDVHATALNRADLLQRRGKYPPPKGESHIIGLECSGVVAACGRDVDPSLVGNRVMALLAGGGYAERVVVDAQMLMPIPASLDFVQAAAIPEAFLTAQEALFTLGQLAPRQRLLVHAAGGGVGSAAIQLARTQSAMIFASAGSPEKLELARSLGADRVINYKSESFSTIISDETKRAGVDVILDFIGGTLWEQHAACLATAGRCVVIGVMGGAQANVNFGQLLFKRHQILGLVMRSRPLADKISITRQFTLKFLPMFDSGHLRPVIDQVFELKDVSDAHRRMEANANLGKIVVKVKT
jgi:putative PIG3 family NAD(P)H quinone oxidoreductase